MVFFFPRKFIKPIFVETPYVADRASAKYSYITYFGGIRFEIAYNIFSTTWVCKSSSGIFWDVAQGLWLTFFYLNWITYLAHYIFLSQLVHGTFLWDTLCRIFAFPYLKGFVTVAVLRGHVQLWELWRLTFQLGSEKCDTIVSCKCGA